MSRSFAALLVVACSGKPTDDVHFDGVDTGTESDTDTDTDTDADTAVVDTAPPPDTGVPVEAACTRLGEWDYNGDGRPDEVFFSGYDALDATLWFYDDSNGDGANEDTWDYVNDPEGNHVSGEHHTDAVPPSIPAVNESFTTVWDGSGNATHEEWDWNRDGVVDLAYDYLYDGYGHLVTETADLRNDGSIEVTWTLTWTPAGELLSVVGIDEVTGLVNYTETYTYSPPNGDVVEDIDADGDAVVDEHYETRFDASGNTVYQLGDTDADGLPNWEYDTFTYDANGNLLSEAGYFIDSGYGVIPETWEWTYDALDRSIGVTRTLEVPGLGVLVYTEEITWSC